MDTSRCLAEIGHQRRAEHRAAGRPLDLAARQQPEGHVGEPGCQDAAASVIARLDEVPELDTAVAGDQAGGRAAPGRSPMLGGDGRTAAAHADPGEVPSYRLVGSERA